MSYSPVTYTGDGSTTDYAISFPYLTEDEVIVTVDGSAASFTFLSASVVRLDSAPESGSSIYIERDTNDDTRDVVWSSATSLTAKQLNTAILQLFYMAQEAKAITDRALFRDYTGKFNAQDRKIYNVAGPEEEGDAANKAYVDSLLETLNSYISSRPAEFPLDCGLVTDAIIANSYDMGTL